MKRLLVCVNYRSDSETLEFLDSISSIEGSEHLKTLVIDNTEGNRGEEFGNQICSKSAMLFSPESNLGYFGGAHFGFSKFVDEHGLPDWVIVSNVDLRINDPDFFHCLDSLATEPKCGVVAPCIESSLTGEDQNPFMAERPSAFRMHFYKWLYRVPMGFNALELTAAVLKRLRSRFAKPTLQEGTRRAVYAPHGSFIIFNRKYFEAGGTLEYPGFLYGEEIFVAETTRRLGLNVIYDPALRVLHEEHVSTGLLKSRKLIQCAADSAAFSADNYFS